jgi:hypothetical protein
MVMEGAHKLVDQGGFRQRPCDVVHVYMLLRCRWDKMCSNRKCCKSQELGTLPDDCGLGLSKDCGLQTR